MPNVLVILVPPAPNRPLGAVSGPDALSAVPPILVLASRSRKKTMKIGCCFTIQMLNLICSNVEIYIGKDDLKSIEIFE
jgi:hypothetical protein